MVGKTRATSPAPTSMDFASFTDFFTGDNANFNALCAFNHAFANC